jgi:hypothetical protein
MLVTSRLWVISSSKNFKDMQLPNEMWLGILGVAFATGLVLGHLLTKTPKQVTHFTKLSEFAAYLFTIKVEKIMAKDIVHTAKVPMIEQLTDAYKTILSDKELTTFDNI